MNTRVIFVAALALLGLPSAQGQTVTLRKEYIYLRGRVIAIEVPAPPPTLAVSPTSLNLGAAAGSSTPASRSVTVSNSGGGTLNWTAAVTVGGSWLSVAPASGVNAGSITVSANASTLAAGQYSGTVAVTASGAAGSPQNIAVTFSVSSPAASVALSPVSLSFSGVQGGASPPTQSLAVSNGGSGTLSWTASSASGWLSASPGSGVDAGTVTAAVNLSGLAAGTYSGSIEVSAPGAGNSPQAVAVSLTVSPPPPTIQVSPAALSFSAEPGGANPASQTLAISNSGGGTLNWTAAVTSGSWLSIVNGSGVNTGTVTVSVTTAGLAAGSYSGTIQISAAGATNSPRNISVSLTLAAPTITVTPSQLSFTGVQGQANPSPQTVNISNTGGGTLSWTASANPAWLTASPASGAAPSTLSVSVNTAGLTAATYQGTITIAATGATNTPQTVTVFLTVSAAGDPPTISLSPSPLNFVATQGATQSVMTLNVANLGGGTMNWTLQIVASGVSADRGSGTNTGNVTVVANVSGLSVGTHPLGYIQVSSPEAGNSPQLVNLYAIINAPPPTIGLSPTTLSFTAPQGGVNPAAQTVSISNSGGGSLTWTLTSSGAWLAVSPSSGTAPSTLSASVNIAGLAAGVYSGTITIAASGASNSPQTIPVQLTVVAFAGSKLGIFYPQGADGKWILDTNGTGVFEAGIDRELVFGQAGDLPVVGDWNGDGRTKIGVFRNGVWYLDWNGTGVFADAVIYNFGRAGDIPLVGNWNGELNGRSKIGVFRNCQWFLDKNGNGQWDGAGTAGGQQCPAGFSCADAYTNFGDKNAGDLPAIGNWGGGVKSKIGVYRGIALGQGWYLDMNGNGVWDKSPSDSYQTTLCPAYCGAQWSAVIGDWNNSGAAKLGVFSSLNQAWQIDFGSGTPTYFNFGVTLTGAKPVVGKW